MRISRKAAAVGALAGVLMLGAGTATVAANGRFTVREQLSGFEEVPPLSSPGVGEFRAQVNGAGTEIRWQLSYSGTESDVTQAHIHFENASNNGPVVVFLCSNLGNGPADIQPCPAAGTTVRGTITADDVLGGAAALGLEAGEIDELAEAMRAGATYVNVHTVGRPGGELRAQLGPRSGRQ